MALSWSAQVVDNLAYSKGLGTPFTEAWRLALLRHPPRGRDAAPVVAVHDNDEATLALFDEQNKPPETVVSFFKRVCRDAYEDRVGAKGGGNGPSLQYFRGDMIRDMDESQPARRSVGSRSRHRQAA